MAAFFIPDWFTLAELAHCPTGPHVFMPAIDFAAAVAQSSVVALLTAAYRADARIGIVHGVGSNAPVRS